jgi:hypothetical protein
MYSRPAQHAALGEIFSGPRQWLNHALALEKYLSTLIKHNTVRLTKK